MIISTNCKVELPRNTKRAKYEYPSQATDKQNAKICSYCH